MIPRLRLKGRPCRCFYLFSYTCPRRCIALNQRKGFSPKLRSFIEGPRRGAGTSHLLRRVLVAGLEPTRYRYQRILSPSRLPIPSYQHIAHTYMLYTRANYNYNRSVNRELQIQVPDTSLLSLLHVHHANVFYGRHIDMTNNASGA